MVQSQGLPNPGYPLVDSTGKVNPVWFQFFNSLFTRTGGGTNTGNIQTISISSTNGIISSVVDANGNATINLSLGGISPTSVTTSGVVSGSGGNFITGLNTMGVLQFGVFTAAVLTPTGYMTVNDSTGTPRRLLVG